MFLNCVLISSSVLYYLTPVSFKLFPSKKKTKKNKEPSRKITALCFGQSFSILRQLYNSGEIRVQTEEEESIDFGKKRKENNPCGEDSTIRKE